MSDSYHYTFPNFADLENNAVTYYFIISPFSSASAEPIICLGGAKISNKVIERGATQSHNLIIYCCRILRVSCLNNLF